jgi:hypothetical protein
MERRTSIVAAVQPTSAAMLLSTVRESEDLEAKHAAAVAAGNNNIGTSSGHSSRTSTAPSKSQQLRPPGTADSENFDESDAAELLGVAVPDTPGGGWNTPRAQLMERRTSIVAAVEPTVAAAMVLNTVQDAVDIPEMVDPMLAMPAAAGAAATTATTATTASAAAAAAATRKKKKALSHSRAASDAVAAELTSNKHKGKSSGDAASSSFQRSTSGVPSPSAANRRLEAALKLQVGEGKTITTHGTAAAKQRPLQENVLLDYTLEQLRNLDRKHVLAIWAHYYRHHHHGHHGHHGHRHRGSKVKGMSHSRSNSTASRKTQQSHHHHKGGRKSSAAQDFSTLQTSELRQLAVHMIFRIIAAFKASLKRAKPKLTAKKLDAIARKEAVFLLPGGTKNSDAFGDKSVHNMMAHLVNSLDTSGKRRVTEMHFVMSFARVAAALLTFKEGGSLGCSVQ